MLAIKSSVLIWTNVHKFCGFVVCISSCYLMKTSMRCGANADPFYIPSHSKKMVNNYLLRTIFQAALPPWVFFRRLTSVKICKSWEMSATFLYLSPSCPQRRKLDLFAEIGFWYDCWAILLYHFVVILAVSNWLCFPVLSGTKICLTGLCDPGSSFLKTGSVFASLWISGTSSWIIKTNCKWLRDCFG